MARQVSSKDDSEEQKNLQGMFRIILIFQHMYPTVISDDAALLERRLLSYTLSPFLALIVGLY